MGTILKQCHKCGLEKPISEFGIAKQYRGGHRHQCKSCCSKFYRTKPETQKRYYKTHKDKIQKIASEWRRNHPENIRTIKKREKLKRNYGMSLEAYREMFDIQNGKCITCLREYPSLCVDHNHTTGMVRGLLCNHCNVALGFVNDNIKILRRMIIYLKKKGGQKFWLKN